MEKKPIIIAITGPTAVGKTDLAMNLTKHLPIEIINMDSAQVYKDMDIGTAKISEKDQADYPHHLIDIITPDKAYSAAQFASDVHDLVPEIINRGCIPLVVGGSILYYKALKEGLADLPSANYALRQELHQIIEKNGYEFLYKELKNVDPITASNIQANDIKRLVRFIEIIRLTKKPPSEIFNRQNKNNSNYHFFHISFIPKDRSWLHNRIEERFKDMIDNGFIDEVRGLLKNYNLDTDMPSMRCAGYRQVLQYLNNEFDNLPPNKSNKSTNTAFQEMTDRGIFATRQLAKRQLTWLRKIEKDIIIDDHNNYSIEYIVDNIKLNI